jgi:hypothetical protein
MAFIGKSTIAEADPNIRTPLDETTIEAVGGEAEIWVYPTGEDPWTEEDGLEESQDRINVQWAVYNVADGGTVVMKAAKKDTGEFTPFKFPNEIQDMTFRVYITKDLTLTGEILADRTFEGYHLDLDGTPMMTAIEGGRAVFGINFILYLLDKNNRGQNEQYLRAQNVTIKNLVSKSAEIHFLGTYEMIHTYWIEDEEGNALDLGIDGINEGKDQTILVDNLKIVDLTYSPRHYALIPIFSHHHGNFTVRNCMTREKVFPIDEDGNPLYPWLHMGIVVGGGDVSAELVNNDVRLASSYSGSLGIQVTVDRRNDAVLRHVLIKNNSIVADVAIAALNNIADVKITDNPGPGGKVIARKIGIMACDPIPDPEYPDPLPIPPRVTVKGNTVRMDSTDKVDPGDEVEKPFYPFTAGFAGIDLSAVQTLNEDIAMTFILTSLSNSLVSNNVFKGAADYAIYMGGTPDVTMWNYVIEDFVLIPGTENTGHDNLFLNNSTCMLEVPSPPDGATYYFGFGTYKNKVRGLTGVSSTYVEDFGTNNDINMILPTGLADKDWSPDFRHGHK